MKIFHNSRLAYIKLFSLLIGAFVGVGFISGAEINQFFVSFDYFGIIGILIFFAIMFCIMFKLLISKYQFKMYNNNYCYYNNTFLIKLRLKKCLSTFNILMIASAMLSGLRVITLNLFGGNIYIYFVMIGFVFFCLLFGIKGLSKIDYIIVCGLIVILLLLILNLKTDNIIYKNEIVTLNNKSVILLIGYSVSYVFMNISSIGAIVGFVKIKWNKKNAILFSFLFSLILSIIILVIYIFLILNRNILCFDMPLLYFFKYKSKPEYYFYAVILLFGLFSTLLSCLIVLKIKVSEFVKNNLLSTSFCLIIAFCFALINFDIFIKIIYPIVGFFNLFILVFL